LWILRFVNSFIAYISRPYFVHYSIGAAKLTAVDNEDQINRLFQIFELYKLAPGKDKRSLLKLQLGHWFEDGTQISIGQWQRLALCRTFAKQADLFVLDEPSSSLDVLSEKELTSTCCSMFDGHIGIIIAHRLQSIASHVTNIIVLDDGEIIESGTHDQLLLNNDFYKKLYSS